MAQYNLRLNTQVYDAAGQLSNEELTYDVGQSDSRMAAHQSHGKRLPPKPHLQKLQGQSLQQRLCRTVTPLFQSPDPPQRSGFYLVKSERA